VRKIWKVITSDTPDKTLAEGTIRHYSSLVAAATALAKSTQPYGQIIRDTGHEARELNDRERAFVEHVCDQLGMDVSETVEGH
jgi:5-methylcytosine-specific restriction endonuclease McrA